MGGGFTAARSVPDGPQDPRGVQLERFGGGTDGAQHALGAVAGPPSVVIDQQRKGVQHQRVDGEVSGQRVGAASARPGYLHPLPCHCRSCAPICALQSICHGKKLPVSLTRMRLERGPLQEEIVLARPGQVCQNHRMELSLLWRSPTLFLGAGVPRSAAASTGMVSRLALVPKLDTSRVSPSECTSAMGNLLPTIWHLPNIRFTCMGARGLLVPCLPC